LRLRYWMKAALAWLTARSTRALRFVLAASVGAAATLWQLSPWNTSPVVGQILFWIAIVTLLLLLAEWPIKAWWVARSTVSLVPKRALTKGTYIDRVVELGRSVMGDGHANSDVLRMRLRRCPDGIDVAVRRSFRTHVSDEVVGYFALWTISAAAANRFHSGEYSSGLDIEEAEFVIERPAAAYVTMLYGADGAARKFMLKVAVNRLRTLFDDGTTVNMLLARPATHDGELLMRKSGMRPLYEPDGVVWSVERTLLRSVLKEVDL
jgi:hypothetical protein